MKQRQIKFRALVQSAKTIRIYNDVGILNGCVLDKKGEVINKAILVQFTGLLDKNGLAEVYEGDIIDSQGLIKGNIYESPQIYKEGIDCLIEGMGTKSWRNTESVAMGFGCKYA